ncbi:tetratricopeptide repeat protein [Luteolibacter flavescens]|uniref:Tetratricopeptide repeat protein n=1 Tax=Luteolibacter flavescens TaxID=1859460 RepID=A0ABT3FLE2_9BACT|nr:tetratricopeptide repeat protein [Luteolibacter flavescens]MCW1884387.1 tetratricopeptide repeat protein [Luteolibacter flavescens]
MAKDVKSAMLRAVVTIRTVLCLLASGTVLAQEPPPRAEPVDPALRADPGQDFYQHGRNLYEAAKQINDLDQRIAGFERAIDVFSRYLNQFPNHPNSEAALWYLGDSYYKSGRVDDAKRCYNNLLRNNPKGKYASAAAFMLAVDHFNNRQYALAAPLFERMAASAQTAPERQRALFHAGFSYELHGRTRDAMDYYRKVIDDADKPNAFLEKSQLYLGRLLSRAEKLDEALPLLDKVVMSRSTPDLRGPAAIEAGAIAAKQGNAELSDKYLKLVLNTAGFEEYRPDAQIAMMKTRFDRKQYSEVVQIFRQSAEKAQGEQEALRLMIAARSYMQMEKNVEALELFREVEKMMLPNNSFAFEANYLRLLCFYRIEGRHVPEQVDAFLQLYRKNRPRDPKIHTALLMKAETLMSDKKPDEAAKVYNEIEASLLSKENRKGYLFNRASCQLLSEDPQGAIRSLSEFIDNYPDDKRSASARLQRAGAYRDSGEPTKALADYDKLRGQETEPEFRALAMLESADICKQENKLEEMITRYRAFLEAFPRSTEARKAKANYWLAWGLVKTNKVKDAIAPAEAARKLDAKIYGKNAGTLLALANWTLQNPDAVCTEVDRAIEESNVASLPDQLISWAAMQAFSSNRFDQAARFYSLVSDAENPRATPKEVWRNYGKALLAAGKAEAALPAINNALELEENEGWKTDGLLDKANALLALNRLDEALKVAEECQVMRPQGRVNAGIRITKGDILMKKNSPSEAVNEYVAVVVFLADEDRLLKPEVLWKLEQALKKKGDNVDADKYRAERERKYPDWKPASA